MLWAPDYDGTNKAWVRYPDGRDVIVGGLSGREMSWRVGQTSQIGSDLDAEWWSRWAREPDFGGGWRSVGEFFGISGFGVNISEAGEGRELVVPHRDRVRRSGGAVRDARGRARFTVAGETVELEPGGLLYVTHEVEREAVALETPTSVLCIGGTPGVPYPGTDQA